MCRPTASPQKRTNDLVLKAHDDAGSVVLLAVAVEVPVGRQLTETTNHRHGYLAELELWAARDSHVPQVQLNGSVLLRGLLDSRKRLRHDFGCLAEAGHAGVQDAIHVVVVQDADDGAQVVRIGVA